MVGRSGRVDDFVEAKRVTRASQKITGRAASRCCCSQKGRKRRSEGGMVVMVVVRQGRIAKASTAVVLVLVLLGDGE
jgi:hypothetical protein